VKGLITAALSGLVFGAGLVVSGMTRPDVVVGFLDLLGPWDPSLGVVMVGALPVHTPLRRVIDHRTAPLCSTSFSRPTRRDIDGRLVGGAALFGVGWGLAGYCPGPAVVSALPGGPKAITFVAAMLGGMLLVHFLDGFAATRVARTAAAEAGR